MPGKNFSRRVARAASIGSGRAHRGQTPRGWSIILLVICVIGVALIGYSRYERQNPTATHATKPSVPPTTASHWQSAISVDICGSFDPTALPATPPGSSSALLTLPHGVMDLAPGRASAPSFYEGNKAVLGLYLDTEGVSLTKSSLTVPGKPVHTKASATKPKATSTSTSTSTTTSTTTAASNGATSTSLGAAGSSTSSSTTTTTTLPKRGPSRHFVAGRTRCGGAPGTLEVLVWKSPSSTNAHHVSPAVAGKLKLRNGQLVVIAFVAKGTQIPKPPGTSTVAQYLIANPHGLATGQSAPTTTLAPASTTPTSGSSTTGSTTGPASGASSTTGPSISAPTTTTPSSAATSSTSAK